MSDEGKRPCSRCGRFSKYLNKEGLCVGCIRGFGGNYTKEVKATGIELDTKPMKFEQYEIPKKIKV
jgi:hypothetical protein